ncbi:MAG TPA: penicillin-binding protein [Phaeodactylibacter sp.]|nr:penicillin-binding protein [Phaeodactylibacter sp.]
MNNENQNLENTEPTVEQEAPLKNQNFLAKKIEVIRTRFLDWVAANPRGRWIFKIIGGLAVSGIAFILLLVVLIWAGAFGKLPNKQQLKNIENYTASEVYSSDKVLLGKYFKENRVNVDFDKISKHFKNALVATEDARFFKHGGVDARAWVRVFVKTILMRDQSGGGGSTISQQLAKNLFKRKKYKFLAIPINKIREMMIARRLEKVYSKEELLALYLNTVPFSRGIYGVNVAAHQFFNTNPTDIKIEDAATIIGSLKANTYYDPTRYPDHAIKRRNTVLAQMKKYKYISQTEFDSLKTLPLEVDYHSENRSKGLATYFREYVRKKVKADLKFYKKSDGSDYDLSTDGLKIYTTIDSRMQKYAEDAMTSHLTKLQKDFDKHWKGKKPWGKDDVILKEVKKSRRYQRLKKRKKTKAEIKTIFDTPVKMTVFSWKGEVEKTMTPLDSVKYYFALLNAGFMAMEPQTGNIKAWVGGTSYKHFQYDHVIQAKRQVGSTFKPIVYTAALRNGIRPCDYVNNRLVIYSDYEDWKPENADGKYGGAYSLRGALTKSVNSVAVNLIMRTGVDTVIDLAHKMGITSDIPKVPAIALGAVDVSLFDMIKVYGTLANKGLRPEPQFLLRIEDSKGNIIIDYENEDKEPLERVLEEDDAIIMTNMMQSVVDSGTARRLRVVYNLQNDLAGKTGTTQSQADGWFIGFTPNLVAGVWVGGESPKIHFRTIRLGQGANTALPIFGKFMQKVDKDSRFKKLKNAKFEELDFAKMLEMDCPPYLEEEPVLVEIPQDSVIYEEEPLDRILDIFKNRKRKKTQQENGNVNVSPNRRLKESQAKRRKRKEAERIRKKNERTRKKRERKKKRRKRWEKLFGKN